MFIEACLSTGVVSYVASMVEEVVSVMVVFFAIGLLCFEKEGLTEEAESVLLDDFCDFLSFCDFFSFSKF